MRKKLIRMLLLMSMLFNIAHASILSIENHCTHNQLSNYIAEQDHATDCGDLCDLHHLFHFAAVVDTPIQLSKLTFKKEKYTTQSHPYQSPLRDSDIKPPIF